jgi:hypothetical protein
MTSREMRFLYPEPGSALAAARDFGIDLSLLLERLRRTPEERICDLQRVMIALEQIRESARRTCDRPSKNTSPARSK